MLTAIDPGTDQGFAVFDGERLIEAGLGMPRALTDVLIELPQIYKTSNPTTIIALAVKVGELKHAIEHVCGKVQLVWPHTWKGNAPKAVMGRRIVSKLDDVELEILGRVQCAAGKRHNVVDAIGLGLWRLGRL